MAKGEAHITDATSIDIVGFDDEIAAMIEQTVENVDGFTRAELIAAKWADNRKVPQIAFKPDWTKNAKAAPFKRNDAMLDVMPVGVVIFPGTAISGKSWR